MSTAPDPRSQRPQPKPLSGMQILFASILAIGLLLAISFGNRISAGQRTEARRIEMQGEISQLQTQQAVLQAELSYVQSDQYVEEWAHSEGKMIRPGEVLIVPVPVGNPLPTPTPRPTAPAILLLEEEAEDDPFPLWWALFFDGPPP